MKIKDKIYKRIVLALCLSAAFGAIGYSALRFAAPDNSPVKENLAALEPDEEKDESEKRSEGLRFRQLQLQDENGIVAPDGLRNARRHIELMKMEREKKSVQNINQIQEAGVLPESWTWLGPGNIGGRIRSILIHPTNPNLMWVGSVSGGIWRTTNGGASWSPVDDFMASLAVSTMIMHPTNPNIMYAGTGEDFCRSLTTRGAHHGAGIFRSTDGGMTWNQLASTDNSDFSFVSRLAISPNGSTILAATSYGIWRTVNGGTTWTRETRDTDVYYDIDFHPTDNSRAIAGKDGATLYSEDGGQSWLYSYQPGLTQRNEIAYAPSNPNVVYLSAFESEDEAFKIYRSTNGGRSFSVVNNGYTSDRQQCYNNALWVNPQDENFLIVGAQHLFRSTDGGATTTKISDDGDSSNGTAHVDQHAIVAHPLFNNSTLRVVFFGNDGGIYKATNVATVSLTSGWTEINNNLGITQFYGAAGNSTSGVILGGTQDNGTLRYQGGTENWTKTIGADGGFVAADQTDPNYFYGEQQRLNVFRSSDGGQSAVLISDGITDTNSANFIAPLILDPNNPNRLLAGSRILWRTNNARAADPLPTWAAIKPKIAPNEDSSNVKYNISAIAVAQGNSNLIVVGHNKGDIYLTTNGTSDTPTWTKINEANMPERFVTSIEIDATRSPNPWIYATFGGYSADNVYRSTNLGATWTDITGEGGLGLPDLPVRTLAIHPHKPNLLYVGTQLGIYTSGNGGATWDLPHGGPANVPVDDLFWVGGDLIAATHGRGLFRASGGLYVDCNYTGTQLGSFDQPFRTVNAAINALTSYRPIFLKPCNYNEQINTTNTNKKFEIRNLGTSATIGIP